MTQTSEPNERERHILGIRYSLESLISKIQGSLTPDEVEEFAWLWESGVNAEIAAVVWNYVGISDATKLTAWFKELHLLNEKAAEALEERGET